jgi:23S rRNA pseudouridine1911/1915/1917 synthase
LLGRDEATSRLSVTLLTGRKHQIRAQLSHFGHPILGDRKYGSPEPFPEGIALVCKRIEMLHPASGDRIEWVIDYPECWAASPGRL